MGYEASFEGRIDLDPPMDAGVWKRLLDQHPTYQAITPNIHKILEPVIRPVLSEDRRRVVAVEPGGYGCSPSTMHTSLRHFVYIAALFNEEQEGRFCRFSGSFDGYGEDGERYRLTVGETDPITTETFNEGE